MRVFDCILFNQEHDMLECRLSEIGDVVDKVIVVDNSLADPFSKLLVHLPTVQHVIVNGAFLIRDETLDATAFPGQPVRAPVIA